MEDDIDKYLYGDDAMVGEVSTQPVPPEQIAAKVFSNTNLEDEEQMAIQTKLRQEEAGADSNEGAEKELERDEGEEEEEEGDEDFEIVLNEPIKRGLTQVSMGPAGSKGHGASTQPGEASSAPGVLNPALAATITSKPSIDINAVGQLNGQSIYDVDLDSFEEKPWKKPGSDITDYFNYGFNETTWRQYCTKQKLMREEHNLQKKIHVVGSSDTGMLNLGMQAQPNSEGMVQHSPLMMPFPPHGFPSAPGGRPPLPPGFPPPPPGFPPLPPGVMMMGQRSGGVNGGGGGPGNMIPPPGMMFPSGPLRPGSQIPSGSTKSQISHPPTSTQSSSVPPSPERPNAQRSSATNSHSHHRRGGDSPNRDRSSGSSRSKGLRKDRSASPGYRSSKRRRD